MDVQIKDRKGEIEISKIKTMKKKEPIADPQKVAACYQPLFNHMYNEHGLTLIVSEMDEIIENVKKVFCLQDELEGRCTCSDKGFTRMVNENFDPMCNNCGKPI
jgi:hypothetical protein